MKNKNGASFVVYDEASLERAKAWLNHFKPTGGIDYEIIIQPYDNSKSARQNSTMWMWYKEWSKDDPSTRSAAELHAHCKETFLMDILESTSERWRDEIERIRDVYRLGEKESALCQYGVLIWSLTTKTLTVEQMSLFLEQIQREAANCGVVLTETDPRKRT